MHLMRKKKSRKVMAERGLCCGCQFFGSIPFFLRVLKQFRFHAVTVYSFGKNGITRQVTFCGFFKKLKNLCFESLHFNGAK